MGYYLHVVPGRLRVKSPAVRKRPGADKEVASLLKTIAGIRSSSLNAVTGSIIINYDPASVSSEEILSSLCDGGYYDPGQVMTNEEYIQDAASKAGQALTKLLFGAAIEKVFEGSVLSYLAVLI